MIGSCAGCSAQSDALKEELLELHRRSGLSVADFRPGSLGELILFPMAADPRVVVQFPKGLSTFRFASDGRHIVATNTSEILLLTLDGGIIKRVPGKLRFEGIAVAEDLDQIVIRANASGLQAEDSVRFYLGRLSSGLDVKPFIEAAYEKRTKFSISPNGKEVVFGLGGQIRILNRTSGIIRSITDGEDPMWDPNGEWISFHSKDAKAMLYHLGSEEIKPILSGARVEDPLIWSPDSQYLLYCDTASFGLLASRFRVYRVRDGVSTRLFDAMDLSTRSFGWVYAPT